MNVSPWLTGAPAAGPHSCPTCARWPRVSARLRPAGGLSLASFFLVESLAAKGPSDAINVVALVNLKTRGSSPLLDTVLWGKDFSLLHPRPLCTAAAGSPAKALQQPSFCPSPLALGHVGGGQAGCAALTQQWAAGWEC